MAPAERSTPDTGGMDAAPCEPSRAGMDAGARGAKHRGQRPRQGCRAPAMDGRCLPQDANSKQKRKTAFRQEAGKRQRVGEVAMAEGSRLTPAVSTLTY